MSLLDPRIRLRHLRCFLETARLGSLTAAARALGVSQPAASKTIRELEECLDCQLFDRGGRRLILTEAGRIFQQHSAAGLGELSRAQELVQGNTTELKGIAIGTIESIAGDLVAKAIFDFRTAFPNCQLTVGTSPNWDLISQLRDGAIDIAIGCRGSADQMEGLTFRTLYTGSIVAVVGRDHPILAEGPILNASRYPLMTPPTTSVMAEPAQEFLTRHDIATGSPLYEATSTGLGRSITRDTDTIWIVPYDTIESELSIGSLTLLPLTPVPTNVTIGFIVRNASIQTPEQKGIIAALERVAASTQKSTSTL